MNREVAANSLYKMLAANESQTGSYLHSVVADNESANSLVVYSNHMDMNLLSNIIPQKFEDFNVKVHFSSYLKANLNSPVPTPMAMADNLDGELLGKEIVELLSMCSEDVLSQVFYETHDRANAITSFSTQFPEVRKRIEALYNQFGFDLLYDMLG